MKWDEARGHVDAFWRRNQHFPVPNYLYKYTFWILFGNKFFHHVRTIDNIYASKWSTTAKANFKPICISKKKARRFLEIFETSEKILKPALNNVKFSHPRRWILKGFMHSELYVGWMLKPITFYTWPGLIPKSATPIEIMLAVFLIRSDQVTVAKSSDFEGFLLFVWSSLG